MSVVSKAKGGNPNTSNGRLCICKSGTSPTSDHPEITGSFLTDSAIIAIRRMIAGRGTPIKTYSDNETKFRGAEKELRNSINEMSKDIIRNEMTIERIEWRFILPATPHMGGSWRRLIQSVQITLPTVLKERSSEEKTSITLLSEV